MSWTIGWIIIKLSEIIGELHSQLINLRNQLHSVKFADAKLNFGTVVAESHPYLVFWGPNVCLKFYIAFQEMIGFNLVFTQ